ncbi:MAG: hypothetical protein QM582_06810 [Micropruina sp.]|uniref:hypothetical protein n=1 Tax=Micropruina sp. TaxID=2737536 RepID=UPI0039E61455
MNSTPTLPAAERLRLASTARIQAEIDEAVAIADLAAEQSWTADSEYDMVGSRPIRIGADGTRLVDEFLALEVAALKSISVTAATWLIRDIVNLQARHPMLWAKTLDGTIPVFRARALADEVASHDLSFDEARELDTRLRPALGAVSWRRLLQRARGLIASIAPTKAEAASTKAREDRYVRLFPTDDTAIGQLAARIDTADGIFFDAMIDRIADILANQGDTDTKDHRRAKAIGILATPARAALMLAEAAGYTDGTVKADDPRLLPTARMYIHLAEEAVMTGHGICRLEGIGPLAVTMLSHLVGHCRIKAVPVIRPYDNYGVDHYEIPAGLRERIMLRDSVEIFPYSARTARSCQLDHTVPYTDNGPPGQTRAANLGPLSTKAHRGKTHGNWHLDQPKPGIFYWKSPAGYQYRVTPHGTRKLGHGNHYQRALDQYLWETDHRPDG